MTIPQPPPSIFEAENAAYVPALDFPEWVSRNLFDPKSELYNADFDPIVEARVGFLWASTGYEKQGRTVAGTAELGATRSVGTKWDSGKRVLQLQEWFNRLDDDSLDYGEPVDFVVTLAADVFADLIAAGEWATALGIVEHELYHCSVKTKEGEIVYDRMTGNPVWALRDHDVTAWVGVAERYGAVEANVDRLVAAINAGPKIARASIEFACGVCGK